MLDITSRVISISSSTLAGSFGVPKEIAKPWKQTAGQQEVQRVLKWPQEDCEHQ